MFEDAFLFSDTVRANIAYGRPDADRRRRRARGRASPGAHEFITALPRGLRHRRRRTGAHAVGWSAAAHLDRPRRPHRSARARARRRDLVGRHRGPRSRSTPPCARSWPDARPSSSPTAARPCASPTASCWSKDGRAVETGTHEELLATLGALPRAARRSRTTTPTAPAHGTATRSRRRPRRSGTATDETEAATRAFVVPAGPDRRRARGLGGSGAGCRRRRWRHRAGAHPRAARRGRRAASRRRRPRRRRGRRGRRPASTSGCGRFLRPYRRPLLIGFGLIVVDTLLTLAGPFLVQQGLNKGVQHHADGRALVGVGAVPRHDPRRLVRDLGVHAVHRSHRRTAAVRAAHPHLRPPATARARLLRPRDVGPDHDPHDHRRRRVRAAAADRADHRAR